MNTETKYTVQVKFGDSWYVLAEPGAYQVTRDEADRLAADVRAAGDIARVIEATSPAVHDPSPDVTERLECGHTIQFHRDRGMPLVCRMWNAPPTFKNKPNDPGTGKGAP